jgi:hypothetical protein
VFRFWWMLIMYLGFALVGIYLKKQNRDLFKYYLVFLLLYPLIAVYFWLHLYIADAMAAWMFSLIFLAFVNGDVSKNGFF